MLSVKAKNNRNEQGLDEMLMPAAVDEGDGHDPSYFFSSTYTTFVSPPGANKKTKQIVFSKFQQVMHFCFLPFSPIINLTI